MFFYTIALLFILIVILAVGLKMINQPLFLSYIVAGVILGPSFLNFIHTNETFSAFSELGVVLLLFLVGIGLTPSNIKEMSKSSLIIGISQIFSTFIVAKLLLMLFHLPSIESTYIAIGLSFSSTIVVIKLLSDKGSLETWHGKLSTGMLLTQDFVAMFIFMITSFQSEGQNVINLILSVLIKGVFSISILFILSYILLKRYGDKIARSTEMLFIFSLAWCFGFASLFQYLGFSLEFGALISGIMISITPFRVEISSRLKPLRDFFIILFFLSLGLQMNINAIWNDWWIITFLTLFVLIIKPIIVSIILRIMGFMKRTALLSGIDMSQLSEFSIIIITLGIKTGSIPKNALPIVTTVMVLSMTVSTYLINFEEKAFRIISPLFPFLNSDKQEEYEIRKYKDKSYDVILFGYNRTGYELVETIKRLKKSILIIDFNPSIIAKVRDMGIDCIFGDASDIDLLKELNFKDAKMIVSTIPDLDSNILMTHEVRHLNKNAIIVLLAHQIDDALKLYDEGATYVIMPHFLGGHYIASLVEQKGLDLVGFLREHIDHKKELIRRKKLGRSHPAQRKESA